MTTRYTQDQKTAFQNLKRRVQRSNAKFQAATQDQKILMVAQDVLTLLSASRIKAGTGDYVRMNTTQLNLQKLQHEGQVEVADILKLPDLQACKVCAIGAGMLATTLRLDQAKVKFDPDNPYCREYFGYLPHPSTDAEGMMSSNAISVFGKSLLRRMEEAFEYHDYGYDRYLLPRSRMKAIYKNLIDNQGKRFTRAGTDVVVWALGQ